MSAPTVIRQGRAADAPPVLAEPTPRWKPALAVVAVWFLVWWFTKGTDTLVLAGRDQTPVMKTMAAFRDEMIAGRSTNPVMVVTGAIADALRAFASAHVHEPHGRNAIAAPALGELLRADKHVDRRIRALELVEE